VSLVVALGVGCGASINAIYEGDVRFERCMALDSRPDVKPTLRSACWEEWMKFYTYGQTRDRVEHAAMRQRQLDQTSDFNEEEWNRPAQRMAAAVPEPTSVLAPPPMTFPTADAGPSAQLAIASPEQPQSAKLCATACDDGLSLCKKDCKTRACSRACTTTYTICMKHCS
jgi:hypothetical protein